MNTAAPASLPDPDFAAVKALFNAVCDEPDSAAALAAAGAPAAIVERVRALLALETGQTTHFSGPVAQMLQSATQELQPGDHLGAWTLVSPLGHGGMGTVFLAERSDGHYQQRAAVKLLRGFSSEVALAQLARERQILAGLQHPHIARLIDGGTTPRGQPYLVMDFVEGQRIDRALQGQGAAAVLALFAQVGSAVAHAHRQLVVHCDLKPANVLVGSDGRAMLLDFGIAQLQGPQGVEPGGELLALTPRYASPEQRDGRPATAASDIYSLGAMLSELLAAAAAPRQSEWQAIVERACADEPDRRYPSVDALLADLDRYRQHRPVLALPQTLPYVGAKWLRRRWPWALAGAGALAMAGGFTLQLVQERDRAVQAEVQALASATQAEREAKRARAQTRLAEAAQAQFRDERDRADAARAEAQAARDQATRERDAARAAEKREQAQRVLAQQAERQAQEEVRTTREVSDFLVGLFDGADPRRGGRADVPVLQLVDTGREQIDTRLADRPELRGRLQGVLGRVYANLGWPVQAQQLLEQAVALERARPQPDRLREAELLAQLAVLLANHKEPGPAAQAARESLSLRQARLPADAPEVADAWNALGLALALGDFIDDARAAYAQSLAIRERAATGPSREVATTLHNLGLLEARAGRVERADEVLRRSAAMKAALLPEGHSDRVNTDRAIGVNLGRLGRTDEALPLLQQVTEQQKKLSGENSELYSADLAEWAHLLRDAGRLPEAIATFERALAVVERAAPNTTSHAVRLNNLAGALTDAGDPAAGLRLEQSLALRRTLVGAQDPLVRRAETALGRWLVTTGGGPGAAERGLALLLAAEASGNGRRLAPDNNDRVDIQLALAQAELALGRVHAAAARAEQLRAVEGQLRPLRRAQWLSLLGLVASAQGQAAQALARQREALAELARQPQGVGILKLRLEVEWALAADAAGETDAVRREWPGLRAALAGQHAESRLHQRLAPLVKTLRLDPP